MDVSFQQMTTTFCTHEAETFCAKLLTYIILRNLYKESSHKSDFQHIKTLYHSSTRNVREEEIVFYFHIFQQVQKDRKSIFLLAKKIIFNDTINTRMSGASTTLHFDLESYFSRGIFFFTNNDESKSERMFELYLHNNGQLRK